jgi:hypothetical protein
MQMLPLRYRSLSMSNYIFIVTFFLAIITILPITPTSNANGHIIVARIKNTGSSHTRAPKCSPNSLIKMANKRLCNIPKTVIPIADEPVRIKNAFKVF